MFTSHRIELFVDDYVGVLDRILILVRRSGWNVKDLHGVEVLNGSTDMDACRKALRYARELGMKTIGASDAHVEKQIGKYVTWLPEKVDNLPDFIAQLHACQPKPAIWNGIDYDIWSEI